MAKKAHKPKPRVSPARLGRWLLGLGLLGGLFGAVSWAGIWILAPENVPLKQVQIEGDIRHTGRESIKRALAPALRGSFFSLDLGAVRSAVEDLPWVTRASVRRVWPRSLLVQVQEREALAHWGEGAVVSPQGEVFTPSAESVPPGLARFHGPEDGAPEMVRRYRWMHGSLAGRGLRIERLSLSERGAWELRLHQGPLLQLGNRDLESRLERFLGAFPRLAKQGRAETVDLRYTGGFAVRWLEAPPGGAERMGAEG